MAPNVTANRGSELQASGTTGKESDDIVFFALNERERRLFFADLSFELPAKSVWAEPKDLVSTDWAATMRRIRPTVLVSCWKTPALNPEWLDDEDFSLRYVCHLTGSIRSLVPRKFLERGILVTNWGLIPRTQVAEHALLLALGALRNQARWRDFIAKSTSNRSIGELGTRTLHGRRIGIHGFGSIAQTLIPMLEPFGVKIAVYAQGVPTELIAATGASPSPDLASLFAQSEVLFECEALNPATQGCVTGDILAQLPDGAVFVNVARGRLVDEAALWREAKDERIRLALDVVCDEPVSIDCPALHLPGAVVSPHIGGPTSDRYVECAKHALENIDRYLRRAEVKSRITPEIFDRST